MRDHEVRHLGLHITAPQYTGSESLSFEREIKVSCAAEYAIDSSRSGTDRESKRFSIFVTGGGFVGLASHSLESEDSLVLCAGTRRPFILRPSGANWTFRGVADFIGSHGDKLMKPWDESMPVFKAYRII